MFRADEPHSYRNDSEDGRPGFVLAVHEPSGVGVVTATRCRITAPDWVEERTVERSDHRTLA